MRATAEAYEIPALDGAPIEPSLLDHYLARRDNLVRFFAARTRSTAEAEDLVQELYLKLQTVDPNTPIANPAALLFRMGANLLHDRVRGERRARERDRVWLYSTHMLVGEEEVVDEPPADEVAASRERLRRLADVVKTMPPQMRRAFQLHKLDGLTHAETAVAMDISTSAVEKHISGALKFLLKRLG